MAEGMLSRYSSSIWKRTCLYVDPNCFTYRVGSHSCVRTLSILSVDTTPVVEETPKETAPVEEPEKKEGKKFSFKSLFSCFGKSTSAVETEEKKEETEEEITMFFGKPTESESENDSEEEIEDPDSDEENSDGENNFGKIDSVKDSSEDSGEDSNEEDSVEDSDED